jgi:hypothetical protein
MTEPPRRVADLFRAITAMSKELETTERRLVALVGNVALSQMLPDSAIKGGTGLKLRFGERLTRDTPDVDTAYRGDLDEFRDTLAEKLVAGWGGFTGTVTGAQRLAAAKGLRRTPGKPPVRDVGVVFESALRVDDVDPPAALPRSQLGAPERGRGSR